MDFLAPLDFPRRSAALLAQGGNRLLSGEAGLNDVLGMVPGAAGAISAALLSPMAGAAVAGGLHGLGALLRPQAFEAPEPGDLVEGLGGDRQSWWQEGAARLLTDPMTYAAGMAVTPWRGLRGAAGAAGAADKAAFDLRAVEAMAGRPPIRTPPALADIVGTPEYLAATQARFEQEAAAQAAAEAAAGAAQSPAQARVPLDMRRGAPAGPGNPPPTAEQLAYLRAQRPLPPDLPPGLDDAGFARRQQTLAAMLHDTMEEGRAGALARDPVGHILGRNAVIDDYLTGLGEFNRRGGDSFGRPPLSEQQVLARAADVMRGESDLAPLLGLPRGDLTRLNASLMNARGGGRLPYAPQGEWAYTPSLDFDLTSDVPKALRDEYFALVDRPAGILWGRQAGPDLEASAEAASGALRHLLEEGYPVDPRKASRAFWDAAHNNAASQVEMTLAHAANMHERDPRFLTGARTDPWFGAQETLDQVGVLSRLLGEGRVMDTARAGAPHHSVNALVKALLARTPPYVLGT